jgi:hypothetical protein
MKTRSFNDLCDSCPPIALQRILRRSDIRTTTDVYSHLTPDYLRAEINKLSFRPKPIGFTSPVLQSEKWGGGVGNLPPSNPRTMSATYFGRGERI